MQKKSKQAIMYLNDPEQERVWEAVKRSFGAGYSISALLYKLVQDRYNEVEDGKTKRMVGQKTLAIAEQILDIDKKILAVVESRHQTVTVGLDNLPSSRGDFSGCDNPPRSEETKQCS